MSVIEGKLYTSLNFPFRVTFAIRNFYDIFDFFVYEMLISSP